MASRCREFRVPIRVRFNRSIRVNKSENARGFERYGRIKDPSKPDASNLDSTGQRDWSRAVLPRLDYPPPFNRSFYAAPHRARPVNSEIHSSIHVDGHCPRMVRHSPLV